MDRWTHLQSILSREALVAVRARERLDRQMYPLVPLQVVVAVEALRALVALERAVGDLARLRRRRAVHALHASGVPAVEAGHHAVVAESADHDGLAAWVVQVAHDGPVRREAALVGVRRLHGRRRTFI
jgi:hypothetical protein